MPQKQKKVVIDDRFKSVLDQKSGFNTISKYDKTGKKVQTQDKMMQKFYRIEKEAEKSSSEEDGEDNENKFYDEEGNFQWQGESSSSSGQSEEGEAELSEKDDEEDDLEHAVWDDDADIPYQETENDDSVGHRIALNKLDWDIISAIDLLALFRSLCSGDKVVTKVQIFPSLYGLE